MIGWTGRAALVDFAVCLHIRDKIEPYRRY
jgi:hypothetical protein